MNFANSTYKLFTFDISNPISFNSGTFLLFFTLFIAVYAAIYRNRTVRTLFVIAFSLFFYYKLTGWFLLVLLFTIAIDYFMAILIFKSKDKIRKRIFLIISVCASLGLLVYFKYTNFFLAGFSALAGSSFTTLNIIIPLGISFYTFRTISYIIDVYREEIKPTYHFFDYVFYMTFFPLLIAGPITRAKQILPQARKHFSIKDVKVGNAIFLILQGLIKKAIIADYIAQYCNLVFDAPGTYSGFENLIAIYAFAGQIYFDFSGYTDIAIGISRLMGFNIGINFNKPYHALNITDFWRRWHISLSSWLRDYLFTPMSLKLRNWGKAGIIFSLIVTFILCGFWHGASFTFIVWGGLHGLAMAYDILTGKLRKRIKKKIKPGIYRFISWFITFHFIVFTWVFFRTQNLSSAMFIFKQIFSNMDLSYFVPFINVRWMFVAITFIGFALYTIPSRWFPKITQRFVDLPYWAKAIVFLAIIQLAIQFQGADVQPFLYARF
ncbi:MAG: MBOAT family O-acyltransferase [Bacteroidales bacterium]